MTLRAVGWASLAISILLTSPAIALAATDPAAAADEPGIVGTWKLVTYENRYKDGHIDRPYGEHPLGYFVCDQTGHLSVQIERNPPTPPFASGQDDKFTNAELLNNVLGYAAYFGTYTVDKAHHVLHHKVEGSLLPSYTGTDQPRPYRLTGDVLIIDVTDPKAGIEYFRELQRVR